MTGIRPLHLARRFVRASWPGGPCTEDAAWVAGILDPGELELWRSLPNHDQRYTIRVARRVDDELAGTEYAGDKRWLAAALLHDTGKLDAGLGVVGRSVATVMGTFAGSARVDSWAHAAGFRQRVAWYLRHDERGAKRIRAAGGGDEAAHWAWAHHHRDRWPESGIPTRVAEALDDADNA
jgi:hypothetical protein